MYFYHLKLDIYANLSQSLDTRSSNSTADQPLISVSTASTSESIPELRSDSQEPSPHNPEEPHSYLSLASRIQHLFEPFPQPYQSPVRQPSSSLPEKDRNTKTSTGALDYRLGPIHISSFDDNNTSIPLGSNTGTTKRTTPGANTTTSDKRKQSKSKKTTHAPTPSKGRTGTDMTANQDADIFQEAESAKGILRLYKDTNEITTGELRYPSDPDETNLETDDKTKDSKSDPHPESQQQQQSGKTRPQIISPDWETTVCVLAVPSYMSPGDFLNFVGPVRSEVSHFRIIRDSVPNRFMVLMKFRSRETTSEFYKRYNGRTFSSLEPEICHVVYLKSIEIRAGCIPPYAFPFLNDDPFLQNNPHSTSSPAASVTLNRTTVISDSNPGANPLSLDEPSDSQHDHPATVVSPTTNADNQSSMIELPTCPVCLERMDSSVTGLLTILCQHTFHCHCLTKWGEGSCPVCRYSQKSFRSTATPMPPGVTASIALHQRRIAATAARTSTQERGNVEEDVAAGLTATTDGVTEDRNECAECGSTDNLWICLICGNIGCGRYQEKHAYHHYYETSHLYALELETQRVWDYAGDGYVHRLIQNKTDGKLVELPSATVAATDRLEPNGRHYRSQGGGDSQPHHSGEDYEVDTIGQEKLDAIGLEYTYLLTSQLESQRMYFDAQMAAMASQLAQLSKETQQREKEMMLLTEQNRELTLHAETLEREKLPSLSKEKKTVEKKLEKAQDKLQILERQYEEEKELNIGLMNNQHNFRDQLKLKEEEILDLQEQVRDMMIYLDTQQRVEASPLKDEIVGGTIGVVATSSQQQPNQTGSGASGSSSTPSPSTNTHSRRKGRR